ncbi:MAG TPA: CPBP family intramembrane glutamic endopeptidase, partial [Phycisphaerae bacterium]|nr:CPBP family intramembrane glutamic endopeptidase [Phycisphaerae bacterium]
MNELFGVLFFWITLVIWLPAALFLIGWWRVLSPRGLATAPTRRSTLSLPVIGGVIVLYILLESALGVGAYAGGWLTKEDLGFAETATTLPVVTTQAAPDTAPAAPEAPVAPPARKMSKEVKLNIIGVLAYLLTAVPMLIVIPRFFREGFAGWGLSWRQLAAGVGRGLTGFSVVYPIVFAVMFGVSLLYEKVGHKVPEHPTMEAFGETQALWEKAFLLFVAVGVAPFMEELFFRGVVQTTLVQYGWGALVPQFMPKGAVPLDARPSAAHRWGAIAIASLGFAFMHQLEHVPIIFVLSLGLGYVYERTGILWASIALHAAFNGLEMAL